MAGGRRGENRVEAQLVQAAGAGQWRFELGALPLEAGSLRVVAGDVALVVERRHRLPPERPAG